MSQRTGQIKVQTQDIFPIIKKWLYSEHDIFIRELLSNACDAITKRHTLSRAQNVEIPEGRIIVKVDKAQKTISISDNGIGLSESEVEKYLAQLAFSGAEEFVAKMKAQGAQASRDDIIGKFGLGFYSAFMVADKVEVHSQSFDTTQKAALWSCQGDVEYQFLSAPTRDIGTTITLFIGNEGEEYLEAWKIRGLIEKYCRFMPFSIVLEEVGKPKDESSDKEEVLNETQPLWKKDPQSLNDEDYKEFYRKLFPYDAEPLFWLHLNIDHPFTLQGILYFPKINLQKPLQEQGIHLYCKQVFVSDNVKSILPDFLQLLKGAIDSVDIPLNVSRSALQGDPNVKKISSYVVKKVAESLRKLAQQDRTRFETVWNDIGLFTKYGCVSDNKFDEIARPFVLFKDTHQKWVTLEEWQKNIPEKHKEKCKNQVLYFDKAHGDEIIRKQLLAEGITTLETDQMIDPHFMQHAEMHKVGEHEIKFVSQESLCSELLKSDLVDATDMEMKDFVIEVMGAPKDEKNPTVEVLKLKSASTAAYYKIDESMKRFQQMTKSMGQGQSFPLTKTLVINPLHPLMQQALKLWKQPAHKDLAKSIVFHVQDLAQISSEGLSAEAKEQFVARSQKLVQDLAAQLPQ
jgi:molecular chaperone HtpG